MYQHTSQWIHFQQQFSSLLPISMHASAVMLRNKQNAIMAERKLDVQLNVNYYCILAEVMSFIINIQVRW